MPLSLISKHLTVDTLVDIGGLWASWAGMPGNLGHLFCTPVVAHAWMCEMETFLLVGGCCVAVSFATFPFTCVCSSAFADSLIMATRFAVRDRKMLNILLVSNFDELGK